MDVTFTCVCPGTPHETDTVTLRETLDLVTWATIRNEILLLVGEKGQPVARFMALLTESYTIKGIESWTLRDEKGKRLEVSEDTIRSNLFTNTAAAFTVSDAADDLYRETIIPLVVRALSDSVGSPPTATSMPESSTKSPTKASTASSSPASPTEPSTSRKTGSSGRRRAPSKRSSISTTPTAGTEVTSASLVVVSNSSQSSESAA